MLALRLKSHPKSIFRQFLTSMRLVNAANYATRKRFYKNTGILGCNGKFEVTLDQRKLKTPAGRVFSVDSEPLALVVAAEWDSQKENIDQTSMHLTSLCNTVIDNPNHLDKYSMVNYIASILTTDTLLYQSGEDKELLEFQEKEWDPVIQWFCDRFEIDIKKTCGFEVPAVTEETRGTIMKHLLSYDISAVHGFMYGVDMLKSLILMLAVVERFLTIERAVYLSRLEEEHQLKFWERVEWSHDLSQLDLQTRISATVLFIYFNSSNIQQRVKGSNAG